MTRCGANPDVTPLFLAPVLVDGSKIPQFIQDLYCISMKNRTLEETSAAIDGAIRAHFEQADDCRQLIQDLAVITKLPSREGEGVDQQIDRAIRALTKAAAPPASRQN